MIFEPDWQNGFEVRGPSRRGSQLRSAPLTDTWEENSEPRMKANRHESKEAKKQKGIRVHWCPFVVESLSAEEMNKGKKKMGR